jgi:hypothetical protein
VKRSDARALGDGWILANEFANVRVSIDTRGNDPRLRIEDLDSGMTICLDAFALSTLTLLDGETLAAHAAPDHANK